MTNPTQIVWMILVLFISMVMIFYNPSGHSNELLVTWGLLAYIGYTITLNRREE